MAKRKMLTKKKITICVVIIFVFIAFASYYGYIVHPIIKIYTGAETVAITEKAINLAVSNVINRSISYDTLIDISYTSTGEISSFTANQYEINTITREIVKEAQLQLNDLGENGLKMNMGTFTGLSFLIGRGPYVNLRLVPIGSVNSNFESEFNSVGINMTRHILYLYINVHVTIVLPIKAYDVYTKNQILLAESIIVGKVPEVYLNGGSLGKSLNLVP